MFQAARSSILNAKSRLKLHTNNETQYKETKVYGDISVTLRIAFKTDHTFSSYLDITSGTAGRRALVTLRIRNHKLMTEIGGYNQTPTDNRHCPFCGCNVQGF